MNKPIINRRIGGEYSTVVLGNVIETMWFGDDGTERVVSRTVIDPAVIARRHIEEDEA